MCANTLIIGDVMRNRMCKATGRCASLLWNRKGAMTHVAFAGALPAHLNRKCENSAILINDEIIELKRKIIFCWKPRPIEQKLNFFFFYCSRAEKGKNTNSAACLTCPDHTPLSKLKYCTVQLNNSNSFPDVTASVNRQKSNSHVYILFINELIQKIVNAWCNKT